MVSTPNKGGGTNAVAAFNQPSPQLVAVDFSEPAQSVVTFIVGAESVKQTFLVPRHLASAHSPFFKAAFESSMIEGATQSMRLEDVEVETFGVLVHWMYKDKVKRGLGVFVNGEGVQDYDMLVLAKVWKLAERLLMPRLQHAAIKEMYDNRSCAQHESVVKLAHFFYAEGGHGDLTCKLFRFAVYLIVME